MAERTTITQVVQLGVEATPGTSVPANRKLNALSVELQPAAAIKLFRPSGGKYPTIQALGKEWTEGKYEGQPTYTEVVYILSSLLQAVTPVQITPPSGLAYRWTFTPAQSSEDAIRTYTIEQGSSVRAHRVSYGLVNSLSFKFDRNETGYSGDILARALVDNITLTASPTEIELVPILPTHITVFIDDTATNIGTTAYTRIVSGEFSVSNRYAPIWPVQASQADWPVHIETEPEVKLSLTMEANVAGMGLLAAMRQGSKRFIRVEAVGGTIETSTNYLFRIDLCGLVDDVLKFEDADGLYAVTWSFRGTYDSGWGRAYEVTVQNKLSAL